MTAAAEGFRVLAIEGDWWGVFDHQGFGYGRFTTEAEAEAEARWLAGNDEGSE